MALLNVEQERRFNHVEVQIETVAETVENIKKGNMRVGYAGYRQVVAKSGMTDAKCRNQVNADQIPTDMLFSRKATSAHGLPRTLTETFKQQVYVTPSGIFDLLHFQFIHQVVGADRIMYAVDYPYINNQGARAFLENAPISQEDKEKIAHGKR